MARVRALPVRKASDHSRMVLCVTCLSHACHMPCTCLSHALHMKAALKILKNCTGLYKDADAALKFLKERKDIDQRKIIVFGRSLGGAVAVHLVAGLTHRNRCVVKCTLRLPTLKTRGYT